MRAAGPKPLNPKSLQLNPRMPRFRQPLVCARQALAALVAGFWILVIEVLPPRWGEFYFFLVVGLPVGLGLSLWRHKVKQHKAENIEKVRPGPWLQGLGRQGGKAPNYKRPNVGCCICIYNKPLESLDSL